MNTALAYSMAAVSAVCFGVASVLEQKGTKQGKSLAGFNLKSFMHLLHNLPFVAGLLLDGVGFVSFVVAVRALPLFFVQAVGTASIAITAVTAHFVLGAKTYRRDYRLMAFLLVGLLLLALVTGKVSATPVSAAVQDGVLAASIAIVAIGALTGIVFAKHPRLTALAGGLCFSAMAVLTRILPAPHPWWHVLFEPLALALAVCGALGIMLFSMAVQIGSVTYTYSITFVTETILPAVVGLVLLGDAPKNHLWAVLVLGLAVTVVSTSALTAGKEYLREP